MFNVVLVEPEIPPNTGNIGRLCVATRSTLHLVKPLGFSLEERQLRRAGLDYWDEVPVQLWDSFDALQRAQPAGFLLVGTGEQLDALEDFHPARIADRILGMGDIVSLVEKAAATIDAEKAARVAEKMRKGAFDLSDLRAVLTYLDSDAGKPELQGIGGLASQTVGVLLRKLVVLEDAGGNDFFNLLDKMRMARKQQYLMSLAKLAKGFETCAAAIGIEVDKDIVEYDRQTIDVIGILANQGQPHR